MADRTPRTHAVVIGASVAGLLAARALADCFERVTVLERETLPTDPEPRKGVPQGHHIHLLLRSGADAIETLYPGFFKELVQRGGVSVDFSTPEGCLVPTRRVETAAARAFGGSLPDAAVSGATLANAPGCHSQRENRGAVPDGRLEMDPDRSRVTGVFIKRSGEGMPPEAEELMKTDLVVDASGRNSATPKWLESGGFAQPEETSVAVRIGYASRFYEAPRAGLESAGGLRARPGEHQVGGGLPRGRQPMDRHAHGLPGRLSSNR